MTSWLRCLAASPGRRLVGGLAALRTHVCCNISADIIRVIRAYVSHPHARRQVPGRRCGARLLSLPDSLAAWRPTGYALPSLPLLPPTSAASHPRNTSSSSSSLVSDLSRRTTRTLLLPPFPRRFQRRRFRQCLRVALKKSDLPFFFLSGSFSSSSKCSSAEEAAVISYCITSSFDKKITPDRVQL